MQKLPPPSPYLLTGASKMHAKNKITQQYYTFVRNRVKHTTATGRSLSPPTQSSYPFCLALWGRLLAPSCYADLHVSLLLGTSVITAFYADLKPGVHQHSDLWLVLATFVLATCYTDLKPGLRQKTDFGLLLATFVITTCYADLKPRVHHNNDVWLPLAAFVIAVCYAEQKPGVRHTKFS